MSLYADLLQYIEQLPVIDSHEHLPNEADRLAQHVDFFTLFSHYCIDDLASAGLSDKDLETLMGEAPVDVKWRLFAPYYAAMADGSYARCAHLAMAKFYGIERLASEDDAVLLTERIQAANKPGLYKRVLTDACGIVTGMNFGGTGTDREFFTPVTFANGYADIHSPQSLAQVEKDAGRSLPTLTRYVEAVGEILAREKGRGTKGIKFPFAYTRPIEFRSVPTADAERVFNRVMDEGQGWRPVTLGYEETRPLQDYLVHRLVEFAGELDLTVVFHVGFQARSWMKLDDTRPGQLWSLFNRYRHVRFNMLHAGIPWMDEAAVMAKHFPNLTLDMGWTHAMSTELSMRAIKAYVDLVPRTKVLGFGGDYCVVEKVYGHLCLARENIARALSEKVTEGALSETSARSWVRALLHDNVSAVYKLDMPPLPVEP